VNHTIRQFERRRSCPQLDPDIAFNRGVESGTHTVAFFPFLFPNAVMLALFGYSQGLLLPGCGWMSKVFWGAATPTDLAGKANPLCFS
jgi:hypothetical protein